MYGFNVGFGAPKGLLCKGLGRGVVTIYELTHALEIFAGEAKCAIKSFTTVERGLR